MGLFKSVAKKVVVAAAMVIGQRIVTRVAVKLKDWLARTPPPPQK